MTEGVSDRSVRKSESSVSVSDWSERESDGSVREGMMGQ